MKARLASLIRRAADRLDPPAPPANWFIGGGALTGIQWGCPYCGQWGCPYCGQSIAIGGTHVCHTSGTGVTFTSGATS